MEMQEKRYKQMYNFIRKQNVNRTYYFYIILFSIATFVGHYYERMDKSENFLLESMNPFLLILQLIIFFAVLHICFFFAQCVWNRWNLERCTPTNRIESFLFEKHAFSSAIIIIGIANIPIMFLFWPGTLQWDAHMQLWQYFGIKEWYANHPIATTWLMGKCVSLGRAMFGSDTIGVFLYTGPQYVLQWCVMAYSLHVMTKLKIPMIWRWISLLYYTLFPLFKIWGYTLVKDTAYYLAILLFITVITDLKVDNKVVGYCFYGKIVLLMISTLGIVLTRNEGKYILTMTFLMGMFFGKKCWKIYILGLVCVILCAIGVEKVWMPSWNIMPGHTKEMLSIPIQQTARCLVM